MIFSVIFVILRLLQLFWRPFIADIGSCCICVSWLGDKIFCCKVLRTQFCTIWWCLVGGVSWNCNHPLFIKFRSFFFERKWVHLHSRLFWWVSVAWPAPRGTAHVWHLAAIHHWSPLSLGLQFTFNFYVKFLCLASRIFFQNWKVFFKKSAVACAGWEERKKKVWT